MVQSEPQQAPVQRRWGLAVGLALVAIAALGARLWLLHHSTGGELPMGPDVEDWVLSARRLASGDPGGLQYHRYPLVPWLAGWLAGVASLPVVTVLAWLSLSSGSLAAVLTALLGRAVAGPRLGLLAGLWVALAPGLVLASLHTTAYPLFALAFLAVLVALVRPAGVLSGLMMAFGALVMVASLAQGALCLIAVLPAALLLRRWWDAVFGAVGGGAGLLVVYLLHPEPYDPVRWMGAEAWQYLSGNVAEERAMAGLGYAQAWWSWVQSALEQPGWLTLGLLVLAVVGLVFTTRRRWGLALAWALGPIVVLLAVMGSAHHLLHLLPVLVVAAALGLRAVHPWARSLPVVLVAAGGLVAWSAVGLPELVRGLGMQLEEERSVAALCDHVEALGPSPVVITAMGPGEIDPVSRAQWACPPHMTVLEAGRPWRGGPALLVAWREAALRQPGLTWAGEPTELTLDPSRSLWLVPVRAGSAAPSPPVPAPGLPPAAGGP